VWQVDSALERQRALTGQLDAEIADVTTRISRRHDVASRPSSLRWNLIADHRIISPRRSHITARSPSAQRLQGASSKQSLPPSGAFGGPLPTAVGPEPAVIDTGTIITSSGVQPTSGQILPLGDAQNYPALATVPSPNVSGPPESVVDSPGVDASTPVAQTFDAVSYRPASDTATERRPSYGHIPPHANTPDNDSTTNTTAAGPGTLGEPTAVSLR